MADDLSLETLYFDTAEGIRLHAKACGPAGAPVLLFVHGFPEFWGTWRRQLAAFSTDYRCVAIDLRGFNLSSQPTDVSAYKPHLLVADLRAVIQALGAPVFAVVAHDWGGAVAWSLAAQHPELMRNFVVLNAPHTITFANALASDPGQQAAGAYMNVLRLPGSERILAKDDYAWLRELLGELTDEELQSYRGCWAHGLTGGCNYYRASPLHPDTPDAPGRMAAVAAMLDPADFQVKVRTQVIWGTGDVALRPVLLEGLEDHVSDLRIHRIEGAGHWVTRRNADEVNRVIRRFLDEKPARDN
ncbi:MAG: alpha/beta hydrolase [Burkholderiaceae bacterium]